MLNFFKRHGLAERSHQMAETSALSITDQIGTTAGEIWQHLSTEGPVSMTKLTKQLGVPRDLVMQSVGWLARENKIQIIQDKRVKTISLRPEEIGKAA